MSRVCRLTVPQWTVYSDEHRFRVLVSGRRFGKTRMAIEELLRAATAEQSCRVWYVAPTYRQAQQICWQMLKDRLSEGRWIARKNESDLSIILKGTGSTISLRGADNFDSLRGVGLHFLVMDEFADIKPEAWFEVLRATLSDTGGRALFTGTPKGRNWAYDLFQRGGSEDYPEWASFSYTTIEGGNVPPEEVEAARRELDELTYLQEYEACHLPSTLVRMADGSEKPIAKILPGDRVLSWQNGVLMPVSVLASRATGNKPILRCFLESGEVFEASDKHNMRINGQHVPLDDCSFVQKVFEPWHPVSKEAKLAAIVGYNLGDGTITVTHQKYFHKGKEYSYQHLRADFYSNCKEDMEFLACHIIECGLSSRATVHYNKTSGIYFVQIGHKAAKILVEKGCIAGKKVGSNVGVPEWIKNGSFEVKKAFCAALFGAEGSTPRSERKGMHSCICLSMKQPRLVKELGELLVSMGVEVTFKHMLNEGMSKIYAQNGFRENIGFLYCKRKQEMLWLFEQYEKCSRWQVRESKRLRSYGYKWKKIGEILGLKMHCVYAYGNSCNTETRRVPNSYQTFNEWKKNRYNNGLLNIDIVNKEQIGSADVWNITVNSPDHSYVLANGLDNFNSFTNFEGRAYYPFAWETHCASLRNLYNPRAPLAFCFDFNVEPGVACICQEVTLPNGLEGTAVIGEVYIPRNSNTPAVCRKLIQDWGKHEGRIVCYGDATGGSRGSAKVEGSDWDLIKAEFRRSPFAQRIAYDVPNSNPPERARVNAMNSRLKSESGDIRLMVDATVAPHVVKDLEGVVLLKGGSGEIDKKSTPELTHISDAMSYYIVRKFPTTKHAMIVSRYSTL